ncbi:hypothetical protein FHS95_003808 [Sphingomonas naasensis]|uniref:Uncharacterized protein n=1 Tax=Sphingomonas naasensis TaxID=1344951 RepID=A0A4S1WGK7_9SPHN|nr:hypothetical protein [Sphingomonas naasensis]NIJ22097.1 hypothetical protein [Sphingomonas naasensis]TGX42231.1 hypothetical protein E5A74_10245 [Sphingomonas naasensis]
MITIWLAGLWLALLAAGDTATGRTMRRILVEAPARALNNVHRGQYLMLLLLILVGGTLGWLTEGESLRMMMMGAPELVGMLASLELGVFVDVLAVALLTASTVRIRTVIVLLRAPFARRAPRARRTHSAPQRQTPANDDDRPAPALAA